VVGKRALGSGGCCRRTTKDLCKEDSSLVLWPPGTADTGSEGADYIIAKQIDLLKQKEIAGQGSG